jgi:hypothetical protein
MDYRYGAQSGLTLYASDLLLEARKKRKEERKEKKGKRGERRKERRRLL